MKSFLFAAALLASGGAAIAQAPTPPGDGITAQGTDPEGQACTPAGFNAGTSAYPPCPAAPAPQQGTSTSPPPCSRTVTDGCIQTYERGVRRPG
ncbi:hypothetical protein [Allosphingosinicella sp.]|jgi:hypothetical protein|uniref:hypothetical protein n=1 Tax=Allosphingosinicella sp. TaxID=2823234 RepID=UPI002F167F43